MISFVKIGVRFSELCLRFFFGSIGPKSSLFSPKPLWVPLWNYYFTQCNLRKILFKIAPKVFIGPHSPQLKMVWTNQLLYKKTLTFWKNQALSCKVCIPGWEVIEDLLSIIPNIDIFVAIFREGSLLEHCLKNPFFEMGKVEYLETHSSKLKEQSQSGITSLRDINRCQQKNERKQRISNTWCR